MNNRQKFTLPIDLNSRKQRVLKIMSTLPSPTTKDRILSQYPYHWKMMVDDLLGLIGRGLVVVDYQGKLEISAEAAEYVEEYLQDWGV